MSKRMTPEQKLLKAIFGTLTPSREQLEEAQERLYEYQANSVTDEEFKKMSGGLTPEEHSRKMMLHVGWAEAVAKWRLEHENERKYVASDSQKVFTFGQVVDMVQLFYRQGQEDAKNGIEEYDRLWTRNRPEQAEKEDAQDTR